MLQHLYTILIILVAQKCCTIELHISAILHTNVCNMIEFYCSAFCRNLHSIDSIEFIALIGSEVLAYIGPGT